MIIAAEEEIQLIKYYRETCAELKPFTFDEARKNSRVSRVLEKSAQVKETDIAC